MKIFRRKFKHSSKFGIDYTDPDTGKRIRRLIGTKPEAELMLADIRLKFFNRNLNPGSPPFLYIPHTPPQQLPEPGFLIWQKLIDRWSAYIESALSPVTNKTYRGRLKFLNKWFEKNNIVYLSDIDVNLVAEMQIEYLKKHKRQSWNNLLRMLKSIMNRAVDWNMISINPIAGCKYLKLKKKFHYFDESEVNLILETAVEPLYTALLIAFNTGIRLGELWQLCWRDIDLENGRLKIKPSESFNLKSSSSFRSIPLRSPVLSHLRQRKGCFNARLCSEYKYAKYIWRDFKNLLDNLGLSGTFHDCRHTFASHLAMRGVPIPVISELLGHSNIKTTMIYAHLSPDTHVEAVDKLPY